MDDTPSQDTRAKSSLRYAHDASVLRVCVQVHVCNRQPRLRKVPGGTHFLGLVSLKSHKPVLVHKQLAVLYAAHRHHLLERILYGGRVGHVQDGPRVCSLEGCNVLLAHHAILHRAKIPVSSCLREHGDLLVQQIKSVVESRAWRRENLCGSSYVLGQVLGSG